jgi:hypothetical protein
MRTRPTIGQPVLLRRRLAQHLIAASGLPSARAIRALTVRTATASASLTRSWPGLSAEASFCSSLRGASASSRRPWRPMLSPWHRNVRR